MLHIPGELGRGCRGGAEVAFLEATAGETLGRGRGSHTCHTETDKINI